MYAVSTFYIQVQFSVMKINIYTIEVTNVKEIEETCKNFKLWLKK